MLESYTNNIDSKTDTELENLQGEMDSVDFLDVGENIWKEDKKDFYEKKIDEIIEIEKKSSIRTVADAVIKDRKLILIGEEILSSHKINIDKKYWFSTIVKIENIKINEWSCRINIYHGVESTPIDTFFFQPSKSKLIHLNKKER